MPASGSEVTAQDIPSDADYAWQRNARRAAHLPIKRLRHISLGPVCTFIFESYDSLLFQVQEMLLTEKGGVEQMLDELATHNPLIPQAGEMVATVTLQIEDPVRRGVFLNQLGGIDERFYLDLGGERIAAVPEGNIQRTRRGGKTRSVHFVRFRFTQAQATAFQTAGAQVTVGCDHPYYGHVAAIAEPSRAELAQDLG